MRAPCTAHTHCRAFLHSEASGMLGHTPFSSLLCVDSWAADPFMCVFTVKLRLRPVSFRNSLAKDTPLRLSSRAIWDRSRGKAINTTRSIIGYYSVYIYKLTPNKKTFVKFMTLKRFSKTIYIGNIHFFILYFYPKIIYNLKMNTICSKDV